MLIAEEQVGVARLLDVVMTQRGYKTQVAGTCSQAIRMARDAAPDVILVDAMMSDQGGSVLMQDLQDDPITAHIPMVILTTEETVDELPDTRLAYVTKPFEPQGLARMVEDVLMSHAQSV